jgi:vesicle-associated membrane protein 7
MPLIYSLVSRGVNVLCEYTLPGRSGNFNSITRVLLKKIPDENNKLSYLYDEYVFHYVVSNGLTYLVMSDRDYLRFNAFQYLAEIEKIFLNLYGQRWQTAIAFAFQADFQRQLQLNMEKFNELKDDKIAKIQSDLNSVKDTMVLNIEKVLERGEKIELLVEKTEILDQHAFKFKRGATELKRKMWWKKTKWLIILLIVLALVLYGILAVGCGGPDLPKCK